MRQRRHGDGRRRVTSRGAPDAGHAGSCSPPGAAASGAFGKDRRGKQTLVGKPRPGGSLERVKNKEPLVPASKPCGNKWVCE